ncbi:hypothetical protein P153DRAFT_198155 [Dothidotthia symphoricarpi CBS 119687]|uniref:Secreted protein n=1 Tax=Dothidotthia symphoricarpi CBS 119687 TaxID=1392245 RepID=A0A6A6AJY6_9PLEO|nr:uncharacterized protein P153DRAFT_198155 [Dothidotthia symphoricarpi CBS 119687]KAF2131543.1 hypothetical protein P153DRAFT_198155 [Dothidotthia symphoricarpi CBS 119687]
MSHLAYAVFALLTCLSLFRLIPLCSCFSHFDTNFLLCSVLVRFGRCGRNVAWLVYREYPDTLRTALLELYISGQ